MKFSEIVEKLGSAGENNSLSSHKELDPEIIGLASVDEAPSGTLSYIEGGKYLSYVEKTAANALILPPDAGLQEKAIARGIAWITVRDPRLVFATVITFFYKPFHPEPEIHPTAVIHPSAEVGTDVYIGPHVFIQAGAKIGNQACIHPNVVIYPGVEIGERTILHANCTIHERARIGADCVIHSGAVIGAEGFGFVPTSQGLFKMEQSGYVVLEDGVEIGCNSTVDRPAVGETRVGHHTKIDNMVHIAHGCKVGSNCAFAGQTGLAAAVKVGNRVLLGGQVGIAPQAEIGDGAVATMRAGIHNDVPAGAVVTGAPAISHKVFLKAAAIYARLPEMYQTIKQLQKQLGNKE